MSLATESANRVRQKTFMINRTPGVFYELKALFLHLAANKGNPDLQLVNIDGTSMSSDGGAADQVICSGACTLYAVYVLKFGATATVFKTANSATATAGDGTDVGPNFSTTTAKDEYLLTFPLGRVYSSGITIAEDTTATGTTDTLKANRLDGFAIIGA